MDDLVLERIKTITSNDLSLIYFFDLKNNIKYSEDINYSDIEIIYLDFVNRYYLSDLSQENESNNSKINKDVNNISIKISILYPELSHFLEDNFDDHLKNINDDLLIFYKKNESKALLLLKSFYPLFDCEKISLPHFCVYSENEKTIKILNNLLKDNENFLCINCK